MRRYQVDTYNYALTDSSRDNAHLVTYSPPCLLNPGYFDTTTKHTETLLLSKHAEREREARQQPGRAFGEPARASPPTELDHDATSSPWSSATTMTGRNLQHSKYYT
jgi:hypothetical protein